MLLVVLYLGFFVVSVPAAVIATLKGRWWLEVLGYLGFVGTILGVSESPLLPFWPWTGVWAVGLTLLIGVFLLEHGLGHGGIAELA